MLLSGAVFAEISGLENIEWRLITLNDGTATAPPGEQRANLSLDAAQQKVSGFAGCNRFFGSYTLDGEAIRFGPLAATRMACPEAESALETGFLEALARTRGWKIEGGELLLVDDGAVLARLSTGQARPDSHTLESLVFHSQVLTSGPVTLAQGEYHVAAAPGSASEVSVRLTDQRAFGTVNDTRSGVIIVITSTGGTGSYVELALLSDTTEGWMNTDTVLLGDRVKVNALAIEGDTVSVSMTMHAVNDPQCCPTQDVQKRYTVRDRQLVPVADKTSMAQSSLVGPVWQWVSTRYNNDTHAVPAHPENYTVLFWDGGSVDIKADCNRKGGTYTSDGSRLSVTILNSTAAACEPGSLEDSFVRDLAAGTIFFFRDGDLYIDLPYDSGTMKFSARQRK